MPLPAALLPSASLYPSSATAPDGLYPSPTLYPSGYTGSLYAPWTYQPEWRMVLLDSLSPGGTAEFTALGELDFAVDRKFTFKLNQPSTLEFKVPLDTDMGQTLVSEGRGIILLYRGGALQMTTAITSLEVVGQGGVAMVGVVATDILWVKLQKALIGKSTTGYSVTTAASKRSFVTDGLFAVWFQHADNIAHYGGFSGPGTVTATATGGPWRYKPLVELCTELAYTLDGFDFANVPIWPFSNSNVDVLTYFHAEDVIGNTMPEAIFEYGTGRSNLSSYRYVIDSAQIVNHAYVLPPDFPDNAGLTVQTDYDATERGNYGGYEEVISTEIVGDTLRDEMAQAHVAVRKAPRELFMITPGVETSNTPRFGRRRYYSAKADAGGTSFDGYRAYDPEIGEEYDYFIGDTITARVNDGGALLLDANLRVYAAEISLTAEGLASIELTVVQEV